MHQRLTELGIAFQTDVPLAPLTWFGVGGPARLLAHPADEVQLAQLTAECHRTQTPLRVLGSGANLLVSDQGVDGVVVKLDADGFKWAKLDQRPVVAAAGYDLFKLVPETARIGLGGLEVLAGIPATVGGAVRMNAGGAYGDIGQSVCHVRVMDETGQIHDRDRDDLVFAYRHTNITEPFILEAAFDLVEDDPDTLVKRYKEIFLAKQASQPFADSTAGCAFKNPPTPEDRTAGQLIDQAGLKGFRIGGAAVSDQHANFIAACDKTCTGADLLAVIDHVQQTVQDRFGISLQREVVVWQ